jgi:hypothetical protein
MGDVPVPADFLTVPALAKVSVPPLGSTSASAWKSKVPLAWLATVDPP